MDKNFVLIIGSGERAKEIMDRSAGPAGAAYKFLGCLSLNGNHPPDRANGLPVLGSTKTLSDYIFHNPVDTVFVASNLSPALSKELLQPALEIGLSVAIPKDVSVCIDPAVKKKIFTRRTSLLGMDTTLLSTVPQRRGYLALKRITDCAIAAIALLLLAPIFLLVAVAIKLSSPKGPIFYRWRVLGKNGKPFVGYKFRTMVPDADKLKEQLRALNEMQGPVFKMRNDPRVLPFGRFLRKFSIDELPQLYSVLKGDMSLVGPRPPSREEAERFEFWQRRKLSVKPGISCLWQVNGRNEIRDFSEWARLDLEYIEHASFLLDLKILLQTIPAVLSGQGAS